MLSFLAILVTLVSIFNATKLKDPTRTNISITIQSDGTYKISSNLDPSADVEAYFIDGMNVTGWGILEISTHPKQHSYTTTDHQLMFAAGLAEGYLTSLRLYQTYNNLESTLYINGPTPQLTKYMNQQTEYENSMIAKNPTDPFWMYASLLQDQLSGLQYGYNLTAKQNGVPTFESNWPFVYLNLIGDLIDLNQCLYTENRFDYRAFKSYKEYLDAKYSLFSHCSAIVHVTPLIDNIFIGHSSWYTYKNTNRIYKHYIFELNMKTATKHMAFSSYPGYLESLDDFYIMDSGLAMLQTTNSVPNNTVYDLVTPDSLYAWQRVRIANALSSTGEAWYKNVANQNSGTYNNQYMIINYGIFKPNEPLPDNFLWVIEQMPGAVAGEDMTQIVERGYWGSYNVPAIESIYNASGYPELVDKFGPQESYDLAPRARIFRRDANTIKNLNDAQNFLRYNNYTTDPIENDDPMWAICSRGDLQKHGSPSGCYDTKVSNLSMVLNMQAVVINGPTYVDNPPFNWNDWPTYSDKHEGVPDLMKFPWVWMESKL